MTRPTLLGIGGAHIDRRGQVAGDFVPGASNPGTMGEEVGGGTFNALRNTVSRGAQGRMMSVRGGDAAGVTVAQAIATAGIADLSVTFLDRTTPSYTAVLSREGDVIAALADMGLYEAAFPKQMRRAAVRDAIALADAVLTDANLPASALERLAELAAAKPLFAIAISPAKAVRLRKVLKDLACLFLNGREAAALTGLAGDAQAPDMVAALRAQGIACAVLSNGGKPVIAYDADNVFTISPPAPRRVADVTGAGDALAGATIAARMRGLPLAQAVREGMACAMLAVESAAAVPAYTPKAFDEALALVPAARPVQEGGHDR